MRPPNCLNEMRVVSEFMIDFIEGYHYRKNYIRSYNIKILRKKIKYTKKFSKQKG